MAASDTRNHTIAAEAAAEIVLQKLEILLSQPVCDGCLSITSSVKDAKAKVATIQEFLSTQYKPSKATEWPWLFLQAMYHAEEFIEKFHLREARKGHKALHMSARPLATLVSKYMLWRDLSNLRNEMEKYQDKFLKGKNKGKGEREKGPACPSSPDSVPWQAPKLARLTYRDWQASTNFGCHETERRQIMKQIREETEGVHGISILGKQGVGKTFLARRVYRQAMYLGFESHAWVHVSTSMDIQELLFEILKQVEKLPTDMKYMDSNKIKLMLAHKLAMPKRFLIVLDDVRQSAKKLFQELLMFMAQFLSQGHIIVTTRDETIARRMYPGEPGLELTTLKDLSDDDIWRMLAMKLHGVPHVPSFTPEEKDIKELIPPLPLCISLIGWLLLYAKEHERAALVKNSSNMSLSDMLQLSYYKLPVHLKPCFIYMALFPVACPIPTRRLVRLWLAEGLLDSHCHDGERKRTLPEDVGEKFILELADRNVIDVVSWRADGSPKACQMLTSLYDMICPIAMSTEFLHMYAANKSNNGNNRGPTGHQQQPTKVRWLAEHTDIVTDGHDNRFSDLYLGHIDSFLSFCLRRGVLSKDISMFLRSITSKTDYSLLRVLDLEGVHKPSLQGVLHKLVLLRYLGLRSTVLDSLPSTIADLHYLETLDIKHTNITSLPSSFWKARNLRHLHLNWFYMNLKKILKACSNNVMALTKLQTLNGLVIGEVRENLMTGHMDSLNTLTTLKLFLKQSDGDTSGAAWATVANWISSRLTNLQSLTIGVINKANPAEEAKEAKSTAEDSQKIEAEPTTWPTGPLPKLSLAEHHHKLLELYLQGPLNEPIWTQLLPGSLKVLTLSGSKVKTDMMPELGNHLRNLRTLRLLANSFLGTRLTFIKDGFPSLEILKIWKLPQLEEVIIEQRAMQHLKELEFRHLDMMKNVQGIKGCEELENICVVVKKGALGFVDHLEKEKGERTNLRKIEETETSESTDDDD